MPAPKKRQLRPSKRAKHAVVAPRPHLRYHVGPLTQFACVFAAHHDVDHPGVPNAQLVKNATIAAAYEGKSVAEQNCGPGLELVRGRRSVISATPCAPRTGDASVPPACCQLCHGDRHYGQGPQGSPRRSLGKAFQESPIAWNRLSDTVKPQGHHCD
jgi:hypothetical protein